MAAIITSLLDIICDRGEQARAVEAKHSKDVPEWVSQTRQEIKMNPEIIRYLDRKGKLLKEGIAAADETLSEICTLLEKGRQPIAASSLLAYVKVFDIAHLRFNKCLLICSLALQKFEAGSLERGDIEKRLTDYKRSWADFASKALPHIQSLKKRVEEQPDLTIDAEEEGENGNMSDENGKDIYEESEEDRDPPFEDAFGLRNMASHLRQGRQQLDDLEGIFSSQATSNPFSNPFGTVGSGIPQYRDPQQDEPQSQSQTNPSPQTNSRPDPSPSLLDAAAAAANEAGAGSAPTVGLAGLAAGLPPAAGGPSTGAAAGAASDIMWMYAQSLSVNFNIHMVVPTKFSGDADKFPEFENLWAKADKQMRSMQFSPVNRLAELRKVLTGTALEYIAHLPVSKDESYVQALRILTAIYKDQKSALMVCVRKALKVPSCSGTVADRQKFHAALIGYKQGTEALGATPQEVLLAFELAVFEAKLDEAWRKDWLKFTSKRKNTAVPLGMDVDFATFINKLHLLLIEQMKIKAASDTAPNRRPTKDAKGAAHAAVAGRGKPGKKPQQQKGRPQQKPGFPAAKSGTGSGGFRNPQGQGRNQGQQRRADNSAPAKKCPFCVQPDKTNKFQHRFPMQCPLVTGDNRMSDEDIRRIIKAARACENCFDSHNTANCDAPRVIHCRKDGCRDRHHSAFH